MWDEIAAMLFPGANGARQMSSNVSSPDQGNSAMAGIGKNAYGLGTHGDQYGRAMAGIRKNAYGLGVHADQYGRAVDDQGKPVVLKQQKAMQKVMQDADDLNRQTARQTVDIQAAGRQRSNAMNVAPAQSPQWAPLAYLQQGMWNGTGNRIMPELPGI